MVTRTVTVAVGQLPATIGDAAANVAAARAALRAAASKRASLLVLPECFLTGYVFETEREARDAALRGDGPEIAALVDECRALNLYCVVGLLESSAGSLFNTAALLGADGLIGTYHKAHLPVMGVDRFTTPGTMASPPVFEVAFGTIGLAICFDIRFPEWFRTLALAGAEIVAVPTNWPARQPAILAEAFPRVRACENRTFVLAANRFDGENGVEFLGHSQIVDPDGTVLAECPSGEGLLVETIDLERARNKRLVIEAGEYELALFDSRRPDLYGAVAAPREHAERARRATRQ